MRMVLKCWGRGVDGEWGKVGGEEGEEGEGRIGRSQSKIMISGVAGVSFLLSSRLFFFLSSSAASKPSDALAGQMI